MSPGAEGVQNRATIDQPLMRHDQAGVFEQMQLTGNRRPAQREVTRQLGRLLGRDRQQGDDLTASRIGEEGDPGSVSSWHGGHGRHDATGGPTLTYLRAGGRERRMTSLVK